MIFEQEYITFEILDVLCIEQGATKTYNEDRNFDALSFRYDSDTVIVTDKEQIELSGSSVSYFPSNVDYTRITNKDRMIVAHFKTFNYFSNSIESYKPENAARYYELFKQLLDKWNAKEVAYKNECSSILNLIFAELYRENRTLGREPKISASLAYIEKGCLKKEFSLAEAAAKSFVSETYFRRLFKKEVGTSPKKFVIERRIKHAQALLMTDYYTVQEVADMCGYQDSKHFSSEFKKLTGVSPSDYRYKFNAGEN